MDEKVRELLDKVRETAVSVGEAAESTARYAGKRAGEVLNITKLNMEIFDLTTEINVLLKEIGQFVYDTHTGIEINSTSVSEKLDAIDQKQLQIARCREQIAALKKTRSCPECGQPCSKEDAFCKHCGGKLS